VVGDPQCDVVQRLLVEDRGCRAGRPRVTQIPGITATSYKHTGLTNCETYYYVVRAVSAGVESASSDEVLAAPVLPKPPARWGYGDRAEGCGRGHGAVVRRRGLSSRDAPIPLKYNLYRGLQPGLASYYKTRPRSTSLRT